MILHKKLSKEQILEIVIMMAAQALPEGVDGDITADFDEEGEIEVYFITKTDSENLN
jgi:hypothetical protein